MSRYGTMQGALDTMRRYQEHSNVLDTLARKAPPMQPQHDYASLARRNLQRPLMTQDLTLAQHNINMDRRKRMFDEADYTDRTLRNWAELGLRERGVKISEQEHQSRQEDVQRQRPVKDITSQVDAETERQILDAMKAGDYERAATIAAARRGGGLSRGSGSGKAGNLSAEEVGLYKQQGIRAGHDLEDVDDAEWQGAFLTAQKELPKGSIQEITARAAQLLDVPNLNDAASVRAAMANAIQKGQNSFLPEAEKKALKAKGQRYAENLFIAGQEYDKKDPKQVLQRMRDLDTIIGTYGGFWSDPDVVDAAQKEREGLTKLVPHESPEAGAAGGTLQRGERNRVLPTLFQSPEGIAAENAARTGFRRGLGRLVAGAGSKVLGIPREPAGSQEAMSLIEETMRKAKASEDADMLALAKAMNQDLAATRAPDSEAPEEFGTQDFLGQGTPPAGPGYTPALAKGPRGIGEDERARAYDIMRRYLAAQRKPAAGLAPRQPTATATAAAEAAPSGALRQRGRAPIIITKNRDGTFSFVSGK